MPDEKRPIKIVKRMPTLLGDVCGYCATDYEENVPEDGLCTNQECPGAKPLLHECGVCGSFWDQLDLNPMTHISASPKDADPTGDCPRENCSATCYAYDEGYVTGCPMCGGRLELTTFVGSCMGVRVESSGWYLGAGQIDTSKESFRCTQCSAGIPAEWVFYKLSRKEAIALMEV